MKKELYGMILKSIMSCLLLGCLMFSGAAQTTSKEEYKDKYDRLVAKVGASGIGVETLLKHWLREYPNDVDALIGKFLYSYSKSQTSQVVGKTQKKYLGQEPVLTLADSLGTVTYYFEELFFNEILFKQAISDIDRVIRLYPDRIDLRFYKVAAYTGYEKESPRQAAAEITSIIDYNATQKPKWEHPDYVINDDYFFSAIQEYCIVYFKYATKDGYDAFYNLTKRMLDYYPKNTMFLNNMGSYYLVALKDEKEASKYYNMVLKLKKDDITAIRSCVLICRNAKDVKGEKKYLEMLAKYGETELDRQAAQVRLDYLNSL